MVVLNNTTYPGKVNKLLHILIYKGAKKELKFLVSMVFVVAVSI